MNLTEKSAYIKGLAEGLELDKTTKEGKIIAALLELVDEMANDVADLRQDTSGIIESCTSKKATAIAIIMGTSITLTRSPAIRKREQQNSANILSINDI